MNLNFNNFPSNQQAPIKTSYYKLCEKNAPYAAVKFILECCHKLEVKPSTFAHAATIFHRFYYNLDRVDYDRFAIASACVFLASKVNEDPIRLRDLINVTQVTLNREEWLNQLENDTLSLSYRDTIVQCELYIMRVLHFSPQSQLPHFYLLNYLQTLENWLPETVTEQTPIAKCAMSLLQDFYFSPSIIRYKPSEVAIAILFLTSQIYGFKIPLVQDHDNWYRSFCIDIRIDTIWEIIDEIMKVYEDGE